LEKHNHVGDNDVSGLSERCRVVGAIARGLPESTARDVTVALSPRVVPS
jgi:hypothetical protein